MLDPGKPLRPGGIRALRECEGASQAVFARYLNVTTGLVSQWERGEKHPQGASLKLLRWLRATDLRPWRDRGTGPPHSAAAIKPVGLAPAAHLPVG